MIDAIVYPTYQASRQRARIGSFEGVRSLQALNQGRQDSQRFRNLYCVSISQLGKV